MKVVRKTHQKNRLRHYRSQIVALKKLLTDARPGLAVYARTVNDPFWDKVVVRVDEALGNPPAFRQDNRSA